MFQKPQRTPNRIQGYRYTNYSSYIIILKYLCNRFNNFCLNSSGQDVIQDDEDAIELGVQDEDLGLAEEEKSEVIMI